jgi:hypothetical protein
MRRALALAMIVGASWAAVAAADGGGPSPGPTWGSPGLLDASRGIRYIALDGGNTTVVEAVATRGGKVPRWTNFRGRYGFPMVAWDGSMGGLTRSGERLVLASPLGPAWTRFLLLDARTFKVLARTRLRGTFAFDALSPDASVMYLIQYLGRWGSLSQPYAVRAFNWDSGRLYPGALVDRREPDEKMNGQPVTRAGSLNGWAYTLYMRPGKKPFVHALDTVHRRAFCVDLPWRDAATWISGAKLRVRGGTLELRYQGGTIARMNRKTLEVTARR